MAGQGHPASDTTTDAAVAAPTGVTRRPPSNRWMEARQCERFGNLSSPRRWPWACSVSVRRKAEPVSARVLTKCADLFIEAGNWNDRTVRATEEMRQLIDGELDYVTRPWRPATRIELWYLADQFYQYPAGFMLVSIEKALGCAAETTRECRPLYAQVAVDRLRVERRLEAVGDYLMSFPLSYSDTLVTRRQIIRFAEVYTQALEPLLEHQHSTMAAVRCLQ